MKQNLHPLTCVLLTVLLTGFCINSSNAQLVNVIRINAGGGAQNFGGETWVADQYFTGGTSYSTSAAISNTTQDQIYQSERWGNVSYAIPVPSAGTYAVDLHFAEIFFNTAGSRVFNINIENGQFVRNNLDLFQTIGSGNQAYVLTADNLIITDGTINISFTGVVDNAKISGISVGRYSATSNFYRGINLNGSALTIDGNSWQASSTAPNFSYSQSNGGLFANQAITLNPSTDANRATMIRSSIWGSTVNLNVTSVPNGSYDVYLYVWEDNNPVTYSVSLEGTVVLANHNSGSGGTWHKLGPFRKTITDGSINVTAQGGDAMISGIEIYTVNNSTIPVTGVSLSPSTLILLPSETAQLTPTISPSNATNQNVSWSSSNEAVAMVSSNGLVTAVSPGSATITATSASNPSITGTSAITVNSPPAGPTPLIELRFNETSGNPVNSGSLSSTFTRSATTPLNSTNVPTNVGGARSLDFGTTVGNYYVESSGIINGLKNLSSFTITGWLNCKSNAVGSGGNRIVSWSWINNGADGVDLVHMGDGKLVIGIDQWPDVSTATSSTGKLTFNASAPASNWVFFAVTYQSSTSEVKFYFGNNATDATLDVTRTYNRGPLGSNIQKLAIGHFNDLIRPGATDRMFRGLIDEIQIHGTALTQSQIVGIQRGTGGTVDVTGVSVSPTTLSLSPSQTAQLTPTIAPSNATNQNVSWTSSNTEVATVTSTGLVTAVGSGSATITVTTTSGGFTATSSVTVSIPVTGVSLSPSTLALSPSQTAQLTPTIAPANATNQNVSWSSSNEAVATVSSNGMVTAVSPGSATITVTTAAGNFTASTSVNVDATVTGVSVSPSTLSLAPGQTGQLIKTISPPNASNQDVTWTSNNTLIATVDNNGLVTAVSNGSTTITVTTVSGSFTATATVNVGIPVTGVDILPSAVQLQPGQTIQLSKNIFPIDATNQSVSWHSNDPTIATVDNSGLVTAIAVGQTAISVVTADGGFAAQMLATVEEAASAATVFNNFAFQYKYDSRKRLTHKKIPGSDWIYMVYDERDRLVMSQDGNQRGKEVAEWTFTKYDELNRPILTGIFLDTQNPKRNQEQMQLDVNSFYEAADDVNNPDNWFEERGDAVHGYTNQSFPKISDESAYFTVTYYDDYDFQSLIAGTPEEIEAFNYDPDQLQETANDEGQLAENFARVHGQVTGTKTKNLGTGEFHWTVNYYDDNYRTIQVIAENHKGGIDKTTYVYDFTGKILRNKTDHTIDVPGSEAITTTRKHTYDHAGRLLKTEHQTNSHDPIILLSNEYNELGQLVTKKLHSEDNGASFLQNEDYRYNIRGWLTRINNADLNTTDGGPKDYFGMELGYNDDLGIGTFNPQFNGNISATKWSAVAGFNLSGLDDASQRAYKFAYDPMNRLVSARHNSKVATWQTSIRFQESVGYDLNGNVKALSRTDGKGSLIDWLIYDYGQNGNRGNRLFSVKDNAIQTAGFKDGNQSGYDYSYDKNGNIIKDLNKSISNTKYNGYLNLKEELEKATGEKIKYLYDANGFKLSEEIYTAGSQAATKRTDYIGPFVYEDDALKFVLHEEGKIILATSSDEDNSPEYQYQIKDHLDNTRLTFTAKPKIEEFKATMEDTGLADFSNPRVQELAFFGNLFETEIRNVNQWLNHSANTIGNAIYLDGFEEKTIGVYSMLKVYPGDKIKMEVFGKYENDAGYSTNPLPIILAALANPLQNAVIDLNESSNLFSTAVLDGISLFLSQKGDDDTKPAAYLNYIYFDQHLNVLDLGFDRIDEAAGFDPQQENTVNFDRLTLEKEIDKSGYLYVYVSNESPGSRVWMDDLTITFEQSPIVQFEDYYPFGLSIKETAFERGNDEYKGFVTTDGMGSKDLGFRHYDPATGRFDAVDPLAEVQLDYSTYQYAANNPVSQIDVLGLDPDGSKKDPKPGKKVKRETVNVKSNSKTVKRVVIGNRRPKEQRHQSNSHRNNNKEKQKAAREKRKEERKLERASRRRDAEDPSLADYRIPTSSRTNSEYNDVSIKGPAYPDTDESANEPIVNSLSNGSANRVADLFDDDLVSDRGNISSTLPIAVIRSYERSMKNPDIENTRQYLFRHHPLNEARALYYRMAIARNDNPFSIELKQTAQVLDNASLAKDVVDEGQISFEKILDEIGKANRSGSDFNFNPTDYDPSGDFFNSSDHTFTFDKKEYHARNIGLGLNGKMDTENPEISISNSLGDYLIHIVFKDGNNGNILLHFDIGSINDLRALLRKLGLDEGRIEEVIEDILDLIREEIASQDPDDDDLAELINLLDAESLEVVSNDEKIDAIEILIDDETEFLDGENEKAVIKSIEGTSDANINDLQEKLRTTETSEGKLIKKVIDRFSDFNYLNEDRHFEELIQVLITQHEKKFSLDPDPKPLNSDDEPVYFGDWHGSTQQISEWERWKFESELTEDGKLVITKTKEVKPFDPYSENWFPASNEPVITITYDNPLEDVVYISPEPPSRLAALTDGQPIIGPAIMIHFDLDEAVNEGIKEGQSYAIDVGALLLGGYYLQSAKGVIFYIELVGVGAASANLTLKVFEDAMVAEGVDPETIADMRKMCTIVEMGAAGIGLIKGVAGVMDDLGPRAQGVLDYTNANPTKFESLTSGAKLKHLQALDGSNQLLELPATSQAIETLATPLKTVVNEISEDLRYLDKADNNITIFARDKTVTVGDNVVELAKITKVNGTDVLEIVDQRILTKLESGDVSKLAQDVVDSPTLLKAVGDNPELVDSWKVLDEAGVPAALKRDPVRLGQIDNYLKKNPGTEAAIKQGLNDVGRYKEEFLNGIKNATEDLSHLNGRSALPNEISDAVVKIKQHRNSLGNTSGGNYGYLEGSVNGSAVDNKMWRSGPAVEGEPQIFDAIEVEGGGGQSWLRTTDSEYKMLNKLASDLGGVKGQSYPSVTGSLKIVSENPYCASCQGVIQQFNQMYPNINLILVDGVR